MKREYLVKLAMSISWMRQRVCDCYGPEADQAAFMEVTEELDGLKDLIYTIAEEDDKQKGEG